MFVLRRFAATHRRRWSGWALSLAALLSLHLQVLASLAPAGSPAAGFAICTASVDPPAGDSGAAWAHAGGAHCPLCAISGNLAPPSRGTPAVVNALGGLSWRAPGSPAAVPAAPAPRGPAQPRAPPNFDRA